MLRETGGGGLLPSEIVGRLLAVAEGQGRWFVMPKSETGLTALTDRERAVLLELAKGQTNGGIAEALCLSVSTIEAYRERMKEKLGVESSPMLLRYAVRWCKDRAE